MSNVSADYTFSAKVYRSSRQHFKLLEQTADSCGISNSAMPDIQSSARLRRQLWAWNWPWPKVQIQESSSASHAYMLNNIGEPTTGLLGRQLGLLSIFTSI